MNIIARKVSETVRAAQMFRWMLVTFWRQIDGRFFYFRDCPDWFVERMARLAARDNDSDQIRAYVEDAKNELALRRKKSPVDWEQQFYGEGVLCEYRPRPTYKGRALLPGRAEHTGKKLVLRPIWLMDDDDSYPGEYALSTIDMNDLLKELDVCWVASGDVVPCLTADN